MALQHSSALIKFIGLLRVIVWNTQKATDALPPTLSSEKYCNDILAIIIILSNIQTMALKSKSPKALKRHFLQRFPIHAGLFNRKRMENNNFFC